MDKPTRRKLQDAIDAAIKEDPSAPRAAITQTVVDQNREALEKWMQAYVSSLVYAARRSKNPYQMFLPFPTLDRQIPTADGFLKLRLATVTTIRRSLKAMKKGRAGRPDPREAKLRKLLAEMEPYSKTERGLTVERYCELRAAGVEPKTKTGKVLARKP